MVGRGQSQSGVSHSASERVLEAIAEKEGTEPIELGQPLNEAVDPDALDSLFEPGATNMRVEFTYLGYEVTVTHDDGVLVDRPDG